MIYLLKVIDLLFWNKLVSWLWWWWRWWGEHIPNHHTIGRSAKPSKRRVGKSIDNFFIPYTLEDSNESRDHFGSFLGHLCYLWFKAFFAYWFPFYYVVSDSFYLHFNYLLWWQNKCIQQKHRQTESNQLLLWYQRLKMVPNKIYGHDCFTSLKQLVLLCKWGFFISMDSLFSRLPGTCYT